MLFPLTFKQFKEGLEQGKLLGLKCNECEHLILPPSILCPRCGGNNLEIRSFSPSGMVRTFTVIRVAPEGFDPPYIVALVELDEGPWVMGNVVNIDADHASMSLMGQRVKVEFRRVPADAYSGGERVALTFIPLASI